jgi:hypothetical protein
VHRGPDGLELEPEALSRPLTGGNEMTRKTKHLGRESGKSSDKWMSPSQPYTGNGRTKRSIFDKVKVVFRKPDGSKS